MPTVSFSQQRRHIVLATLWTAGILLRGASSAAGSWTCPCLSWGCQAACPCACPCPCGDPSLCAPLTQTPGTKARPEVVAYHAHLYNETGCDQVGPDGLPLGPGSPCPTARVGTQHWAGYPWDRITTIAIYTGIDQPAPFAANNTGTPLLICTAHRRSVKVIQGVGGQWTQGPWTAENLNDTAKRRALAKQYIDSAVLYGMDGLNLDVEYDGSVRSTQWYQEHARLLTLFTCELRAMIHNFSYVPSTFQLSFASDLLPAASADRFDFKGLAQCLDFFTPMAYFEPLENLAHGVAQYQSLGVPPSKLVTIFAWFGADVQCTNSSGACALKYPHCYAVGTGDGHECQPGYSTIAHDLLPKSTHMPASWGAVSGLQWNEAASLPFFDYVGNNSVRHRVSFTDANSTRLRAEWAHQASLGGVGIWTADALDTISYPQDGVEMWGALLA